MKISMWKRPDGLWQADAIIDGNDYHAAGATRGKALIELGAFMERQEVDRPVSDIEVLARLVVE